MKSLNNSFIFQELINSSKLNKTLTSINFDRDTILSERVPNIETIYKKFNFPLKSTVITYLNNNEIKMIYNDDNPLPRYLSSLVFKTDKGFLSVVDLTNFGKMNKVLQPEYSVSGKPIDIPTRMLFTLLQNAVIQLLFAKKWDDFITNIPLIRWSCASYTKLVCKVLDKMMGININEDRSDTIHFLVAKFFLINVVEMYNAKSINNIASLCTPNETSESFLVDAETRFIEIFNNKSNTKGSPYENIYNFVQLLSLIPTMEGLTFRGLVEQFLRMYGEASMLSLDYYPSFIALIFGTDVGAGLNKDFVIENVSGKINKKILIEFCKSI